MPEYRIPNLAHACDVLNHLATCAEPQALSPLARTLGLPRTSLLRIVSTLVEATFLVEQEGRYALGPGLIPLGQAVLARMDLRATAAAFVRRLAEETNETAHLAVPSGDQGLLLEVTQSPHPIRVGAPAGTLVDIVCSATGKCFLAYLHRDRLGDFFPHPARTKRTLTTAEAMAAELVQIESQGWALDDEEYADGVRCLAAPVWDATGRVVAALGITGTTGSFPKARIPAVARQVTRCAAELSRALGSAARD